VTNTSDKRIYFLALNVEMPDVPLESGALAVFPLRYGRADFYDHDTKPLPDDLPIEPNATYTFAFDENNKNGWESLRAKKKRTDPMKLVVSFNHLNFGDGTGFTSLSGIPFHSRTRRKNLVVVLRNSDHPTSGQKHQLFLLYMRRISKHRQPLCR
jgi:hypothetical protein